MKSENGPEAAFALGDIPFEISVSGRAPVSLFQVLHFCSN
jgi:hypothetical protein